MTIRTQIILGSLLLSVSTIQAQVSVDNTLTAQQLIEDYLIGEGVEVNNITINGQPENTVNSQAGLYTGVSNFIDFESGVVMTTANATIVTGGGCIGTVNGSVTITVDEPLNEAGDDITQTYCGDGSPLVLSPAAGQPTNGIFSPSSIILSPSNSGDYNYIVGDGVCAPDVAIYTIDIHEPLSVSAIQTSCELDSTEYTVTFTINGGTGIGTYSVDGVPILSNIFTSLAIPISDNYSFVIDDSGPCEDITTSGSAPNCSCPISAGFASSNQTICIGSSVEIAINLNGGVEGQYEFVYSDGTNSDTISGASDGHIITLNPTTTTTYTLQSVMDTVCIGNVNSTVTITVDQLNDAGNDHAYQYCGDGSNLVFTPSPGEPTTGGFSSNFIPLLSGNSGNYDYTVSSGQCPPDVATYTINISDELNANSVATCQPNETEYTTQITITGGIQPYFVNGAIISGSTFTSATIPLGTDYNFVISDSGSCDNVNVSGTLPNCSCSARANFASGNERICLGSAATIGFNLSGGINGSYEIVYSDGTDNYTVSGASNGQTITVYPSTTTTYTLVSVTGGLDGNFLSHLTNDPDLMAIAGQNIYDEIVIEFDFKAVSDSIKFNYVFASKEYPSYTCSQFNDAFGFFLSGPGINGSFMNNAENIALIPDTDIPVAINTINGGTPTGIGVASNCFDANPNWVEDSQYFVSNNSTPQGDVQFPGMTQTFTAIAGGLHCGEWYHIKLAIGDAVDGNLDSGVFLEAGSFTAFGGVSLSVVPQIGGGAVVNPLYDSVLVAGCSEAFIQLIRPTGVLVDSIFVQFGGTSIEGEDYELGENDTLFFFPDGVDTLGFTITTIYDGVPGEDEYLTITIFYLNGCGGSDLDSASTTIPFVDPYSLVAKTEDVVVTCPADSVLIHAQVMDGIEPYDYDWGDDLGGNDSTTYVAVPPDEQYYVVAIKDACGFETVYDSVKVTNNIPPPLQVGIDPFVQPDCTNQPIALYTTTQGGNGEYTFIWEDGLNNNYPSNSGIGVEDINSIIQFDPEPIGYTATLPVYVSVIDTCGTIVKDSVQINYPFFDPMKVAYNALTDNCPKDPVRLTATTQGGAGDTNFQWEVEQGDAYFPEGSVATTAETYVVPSGGLNQFTVVAADKCNRAGYDYRYVVGNAIAFGGLATYTDSVRILKLDHLMNVMTPNGDGMNDYFVVEGIEYFDDAHVQIFDRWGKMVYETKNYRASSATLNPDGSFDGRDLDDGTYFYVINVDQGECVKSGQIEILRKNN